MASVPSWSKAELAEILSFGYLFKLGNYSCRIRVSPALFKRLKAPAYFFLSYRLPNPALEVKYARS
jgi:hypothetical protein